MKRLYFIRHGLSELNEQGLFAGHTETPLSENGIRQAHEAGKALKDFGIDYIVSSPLSRAVDTALIIAEEIGYPPHKLHINKLFIERDLGELEGKPWSPDLNLDGFSDIETVDTLLERARLAKLFLEHQNADTVLVVSHGAFGRAFRSLFMPEYPIDHPARFENGQFVILL